MSALSKQVDHISVAILAVLVNTDKPLNIEQIQHLSELRNLSIFGFEYAMRELENKNVVRYVEPCHYELPTTDNVQFLELINEYIVNNVLLPYNLMYLMYVK